ncbi:thrombospondin type 3 repeat-containing protein [Pontibacterium granulatum]|uniref:thrombospondin type 3 repeat-containing protein n=1 Tax=Pontibacterium granulatum TaxID=2036029 RepID=UPI00249C0E86|nr:thrombospondin type 3 repeat-containing protein [Pontibacterium granulatum]MDI3325445.1 thrombospondin type 3 repeat-containing protein [Pontibacterium granulatum]
MDPNPDQADLDGDSIGDVRDDDRDGDGLKNKCDKCPDDSAEPLDRKGCPVIP